MIDATTIEWTRIGAPDTIVKHWHWYDGKRDMLHMVCVFYGIHEWTYRLPGNRPVGGYATADDAMRAAETELSREGRENE